MKKKSPDAIIDLGESLYANLKECRLCPRECGVDRFAGELGHCRSGVEPMVASYNLHFGEEPPLSGGSGSGTIFLSNCSLSCRYCQNYPISQMGNGAVVSIEELKGMILDLYRRGADNINFVTPDHMLPMILTALGRAKREGLDIPIVHNCSGYQKLEIIRQLDGIIDIYLVDMRYNDSRLAREYSGCEDYAAINRAAVKEMYRQVGNLKFNRRGMARSGILVRHLVLPNNISGSGGIFRFLAEEVSRDVYVSVMSQYFPAYKAVGDPDIGRRLTAREYRKAVDSFHGSGLQRGYIQDMQYEPIV